MQFVMIVLRINIYVRKRGRHMVVSRIDLIIWITRFNAKLGEMVEFLSASVPGLISTLPDPEIWSTGNVRIPIGRNTPEGFVVDRCWCRDHRYRITSRSSG